MRNSNHLRRIITLVFAIALGGSVRVCAQDVTVNGGFFEDSLKIGESSRFYVSAHYPSNLNILFPDSTFKFATFEYAGLQYFPTKTKNGISVDSAIYRLTTFEVDRVQYLHMPVYSVHPGDCTVYQTPQDSILISQMVANVPDSVSADKLPLKMNTAYQKVFFEFNTWVLIIAIGILIVAALLVWVLFGKRIARHYRLRKLRRMHAQFVAAYNQTVAPLQTTFNSRQAETALAAWKKYMERLEAMPYTKLTTKETLRIIKDEHLGANLREIDRAIYGEMKTPLNHFEDLRKFADERFFKKLEEVQRG